MLGKVTVQNTGDPNIKWDALNIPGVPPNPNTGTADMGLYGPTVTPLKNNLFNAATTDWARVLTCLPNPDTTIVSKITLNVIKTLAHLPTG